MPKKELFDVIVSLKKPSDDHEEKSHRTTRNFLSEIFNFRKGFKELASIDLDHEEYVGKQLLVHWISGNNQYKYPPNLYATYLDNHVLKLEKRSRYLGRLLSFFGILIAILLVNLSKTWDFVLIFAVFIFLCLTIIDNLDKKIVYIKQIVNHLRSFPEQTPNHQMHPTSFVGG